MSFQVDVDTQEELDRCGTRCSPTVDGVDVRAAVRPLGVAWQVTPSMMGELMTGSGDPAANQRVYQAMMQMQKLDNAALRAAAAGS